MSMKIKMGDGGLGEEEERGRGGEGERGRKWEEGRREVRGE